MVANRISAKWVHIFNFKMVFENKDHFLVKKLCAVHCAFILYSYYMENSVRAAEWASQGFLTVASGE